MGRPTLTERRKAQTRREIAETALALFARQGYDGVSAETIAEEAGGILIGLFLDVPALRAQWHEDLRKIEAALIPVVHKRARRPLTDYHAELSAAAALTGLRVALERAARSAPPASSADTLREALAYLRDGAKL